METDTGIVSLLKIGYIFQMIQNSNVKFRFGEKGAIELKIFELVLYTLY